MDFVTDPVDRCLLDDWQRDLPITPRPFAEIGGKLGLSEAEVISRLGQMLGSGRITRVGGTCAPNIVSASTLAAVAAPPERVEEVAAIIGAEPGVNHSYLREHDLNLWFVATGPDRAHVNMVLTRIGARSGLRVLDLPLVRAFNVDLGFRMAGGGGKPPARRPVVGAAIEPGDRPILQALTSGLPSHDHSPQQSCLTPWWVWVSRGTLPQIGQRMSVIAGSIGSPSRLIGAA